MTFTRLSHTGIVAADLDATATEFEELLQVTWLRPRVETLRLWTSAGSVRATFRFTYSRPRAGEPMIELVEAGPNTPWWPGDGAPARLHHIGFWADSLAADSAALANSGAPVETASLDRDGMVTLFAYHQLAHGPRVELVAPQQQRALAEWMDGGE